MLGDRKVIGGRFWSANGFAIAVVAVITEGVDWAAYIGGGSGIHHSCILVGGDEFPEITEKRGDCEGWTAKYGEKLFEDDARHFFKNIDLPYRT